MMVSIDQESLDSIRELERRIEHAQELRRAPQFARHADRIATNLHAAAVAAGEAAHVAQLILREGAHREE